MAITALIALGAACSGGAGTDGGATLQSAALDGYVFEVDGQTADREGIDVRVLETGEVATTDFDGRFSFDSLPTGSVTLEFGSTLVALAHMGGDGMGEQEQEQEQEHEREHAAEDEDEHGHPRMNGLVEGDRVRVRCSIEDGEVREFFMAGVDRLRAMTVLTRDPDSPDADVKGKVKVETRDDREKFEVEVEHLAPGTTVNIYLAAPPAEGADPVFSLIGTATANAEGEAELEFNTNDGDRLPLGKQIVDELAGYLVEVRLDSETEPLLLTGEVPSLPDEDFPQPGDGMQAGVRARSRVRLVAAESGLEGHVELRRREDGRQEFKVEAENVAPGRMLALLLEEPAGSGQFAQFATCQANPEGECEIEFRNTLPFGITDITDLVGRQVQVRDMGDGGPNRLLLSATVPALVAD